MAKKIIVLKTYWKNFQPNTMLELESDNPVCQQLLGQGMAREADAKQRQSFINKKIAATKQANKTKSTKEVKD